MEIELIVLLVVQLLGSISFARFEIETPVLRKILKKNGIDPLKATPKKKYYKLRGWKWEE